MARSDISDRKFSDTPDGSHGSEARNDGDKFNFEARSNEEKSSSEEKTDETWQTFAKKLRKQDRETAKMWKEEIDTLMNFAGLYSVILAAFNIELYKRLVPDEPTSDTSTLALIHLISAANNLALPSTLATSASPAGPPAAAVWINALMFSSLVLGLATAFVGLIIREWLNFFLSPHSGEGERSTYIHCLRWDRGVIKWHVPGILSALSILLQTALALFLSGLLLFLWTVERKVAIVTTSIVCALGAFWLFTTVAPGFSNWCPYKSPQALAFVWFLHWIQSCKEGFLGRAQKWDNLANFRTSTSLEDLSAVTTLRKFDGDWGSIERYTFNSMLDGDRKHRRTLKWIRDNVFALGHKLLMDDSLFSQFIQCCLHSTMADRILDDGSSHDGKSQTWLLSRFNGQPDQSITQYALRVQAVRSISILPRLRSIVQYGDPLSHSARSDIANSAADALDTLLLPGLDIPIGSETEKHIEFLAPYICAGSSSCMAAVLHYFGRKSVQARKDETMTQRFVDGLIHYAYPSRIWAHEQLILDEQGREYAVSIVEFIHDKILCKTLTPPRKISPAKDHRLYNACCLGMLLAMSIDPSQCSTMLPALVGHLQYYYDRENGKPVDAAVITWLASGYKSVREAI